MCFAGYPAGAKRTCPDKKVCDDNTFTVCRRPESAMGQELDEFHMDYEKPEELKFCQPDNDYTVYDLDCPGLIRETNQTLPNTGCKKFIHCGVTEVVVYQCPDDFYFDGVVCSATYVCPHPCLPLPKLNKTDSVLRSNLAMFGVGINRWPIEGTNCEEYMEWTTNSVGSIEQSRRRCPLWSWFDPNVLRCRMRYLCNDLPISLQLCPRK